MADLYTKIVSGVFFPAHEAIKKHNTVRLRRAMERSQWDTVSQLEQLQLERLQILLQDAARHVPYYRKLFSELGIVPEEFTSLAKLENLPFLTKNLIRDNTEDLKNERSSGLTRFNTGGSSGEPLIFFLGNQRVSHDVAAKWRATRWWGVDIGDPEVVVWGSPIELGAQDKLRYWRDKIFRTSLIPAFEMSDRKLDNFIHEIRCAAPRMLFGYPSSLAHIALHAEKRGQRMDDLGLRVAFVTSERLYDHQRSTIERVFGCPVANGYGGRDAGFIAHQCPAGNMHITAEDIIVEIVDNDGNRLPPGEQGEIVITHLATRDFPFIRYRTGDVGVLDSDTCSCGRGLPLLKEIQGRTTDFIIASDGTVMHGLALIYVIRDVPGVENFKILQESLAMTKVWLVTSASFLPESVEQIRKGVMARLGQDVTIEIHCVDKIPVEASGKFRYVMSKVPATSVSG